MVTDKRRVFSIGTWSPALRTMLNSRIEPCGCVVGVYLSWRGKPVDVIDVANPRCANHHRFGEIGEVPSAATTPVERR